MVNIAGVVTLSHPLQDVHPFFFREREEVIVRRSPSLSGVVYQQVSMERMTGQIQQFFYLMDP